MNAMSQLHFLRPLWLFGLLALPVIAWWWRRERGRETAWRHHVDAHLLPHLLEAGGQRVRGTGIAWMLALLLAVLALAGPAWRLGDTPLWRSQRPLVVALDLSSAALASDLPPSRLLQARAKLATLLRERDGGQVGLVVFADDAYTVAPLTQDIGNVALFLDALSPDVMPVDGHRAERAIAWSARLLEQAGFDHGDILLITDHAGGEARNAAGAAARRGFRVSVLGLGTVAGALYRNAGGELVRARLDEGSLSSLARAGDGSYAAMRSGGDADLRALGLLSAAQADSVMAPGEGGRSWRDEGYWLLPPLMLLALLGFRRGAGAGTAAVLLIALLPWPQARAQTGTLWQRADQVAHARMEAGERAYRAGEYARAAEQYAGLHNADAQYNLGNALAQHGKYAQAIDAYDRALRMQPGMADAIANKRAVEAAMKRKPPPGQGRRPGDQAGQGQAPQSQSQQGKQSSPSQSGSSGASPGDDDRQPPQSPSTAQGQGQPPPKPRTQADVTAQRAADAAQRERMQRALRGRSASAPAGGPERGRTETRAQREQRLANEAWLQRVPDDPGGLLRTKFRLEYERRQQQGDP